MRKSDTLLAFLLGLLTGLICAAILIKVSKMEPDKKEKKNPETETKILNAYNLQDSVWQENFMRNPPKDTILTFFNEEGSVDSQQIILSGKSLTKPIYLPQYSSSAWPYKSM